jgi:hypothetical protein
MCGNGLPADPSKSRSVLTIVLTILVVGALFAGAFMYGKWKADVTPMSASVPAFAPTLKAKPSTRPEGTPVVADPTDQSGKPRP